jgi:hypothetical protein
MNSTLQAVYCGYCPQCDWEYWAKSVKSEKMFCRLHKKKCKKTGRTKQAECRTGVVKKGELFSKERKMAEKSLKVFVGEKEVTSLTAKYGKVKETKGLENLNEWGHEVKKIGSAKN